MAFCHLRGAKTHCFLSFVVVGAKRLKANCRLNFGRCARHLPKVEVGLGQLYLGEAASCPFPFSPPARSPYLLFRRWGDGREWATRGWVGVVKYTVGYHLRLGRRAFRTKPRAPLRPRLVVGAVIKRKPSCCAPSKVRERREYGWEH